ncbi:MAG: hypothetical protein CSA52_03435 [Gammaproteobacteria bacterium]|nr:MAG: hypothetical protein CSB48_04165 [Pseudomonadota bacterium]PIE38246.1 MAG: hypothetical protein CSA52_03435 [Gammaproteobacteria bacterium]
MSIKLFTTYSDQPAHPRTESIQKTLGKLDRVEVIYVKKTRHILNQLFFGYFWLYESYRCLQHIEKQDDVLIQDLRLLPLLYLIRLTGKKNLVVYETLDNNVASKHHQLTTQYPSFHFSLLLNIIRYIARKFEQLSPRFSDSVVVNSLALASYFNNDAKLIYYTSPLEQKCNNNPRTTSLAFIYLGLFTIDKGALHILELVSRTSLPLFIFGSVLEKKVANEIPKFANVHHIERLPSDELADHINRLTNKYFLIGWSLIEPIHSSYATQEANKEIDYLAIGIPFIGNHRETTWQKINAGCGAYTENIETFLQEMQQGENREIIRDVCLTYYKDHYANEIFNSRFHALFDRNKRIESIYSQELSSTNALPQNDDQKKFILDHIPFEKSVSVLDAGCGNGRYSKYLKAEGYHTVFSVDLFDRSPEKELSYCAATIENLPFKDDSFDFIFSNSVIYYLANPENGLIELKRVLKPGGTLIFSGHTKYSIYTLSRVIKRDFFHSRHVRHLRGVTFRGTDYYRLALQQTGFEILEENGFRFLPRPIGLLLGKCRIPNSSTKKAKQSNTTNPDVITKIKRRLMSSHAYHFIFIAKNNG